MVVGGTAWLWQPCHPGDIRSAFTSYENGQAFGKVVTIGAVSAGTKNGKCATMSARSVDGDVITAKVVY